MSMKIIVALLCLSLAACGPRPQSSTPAVETAAPATDPVADALIGSAQRTLGRRYPNADVILAEQVIANDSDAMKVCGRYMLITRDTRRDRFFVVSATDLTELKSKADPRWVESCAAAKPAPGAVSAVEAENLAAGLPRR